MADTPTTTRQIAGDDIISELLRNQQSGLFKLRYTVLAPCIYHVYLHPGDYDYLRPVLRHVREEAAEALQEQLDRWNKEAAGPQVLRWLGVDAGSRLEYRITAESWTVELHADEEDKLAPGDIEIYSELGSEPQEELDAGERTRLITKRDADGQTSARKEAIPPAEKPRTDAYAVLRYRDEAGDHEYYVTKDLIVVGRGGKSYWVDVKLESQPDISREHCRIRRDPATRDFYIKDLSQFGTSINSQSAPTSLELLPDGQRRDKNVEVPLPSRARISLAGLVEMEFMKLEKA